MALASRGKRIRKEETSSEGHASLNNVRSPGHACECEDRGATAGTFGRLVIRVGQKCRCMYEVSITDEYGYAGQAAKGSGACGRVE